jgi:hypothetical protein
MLRLILLAIAGTAVIFSGSDNTLDFTVNPDGSGKAVVETILPPMPPEAVSNMGADDVLAAQVAKQMLRMTPDVEVWADVTVGKTEDGRIRFKGTAYFKDIATVDLGPSKDDAVTWAKDPQGGMLLAVETKGRKPQPPAVAAEPPKLSDEEIAKQIDAARQRFKKMATNMGQMKTELIYRLPGTVSDVAGFTKADDGSLHWSLDGVKALQAAEKAMADDAFLRECILAGKNPMLTVLEKDFLPTLKARASGDLKPLFDYAAEVKAAKDALPKMLEKLGLGKKPEKAETPAAPEKPTTPAETPKAAPVEAPK